MKKTAEVPSFKHRPAIQPMCIPDPKKPLNILYVEDDELILELGRLALAEVGGLSVQVCQNGAQALDALSTYRPDVLLLDVVMAGMDGPALLKEIRRRQMTDAPVIFMTSRVDYANVQQYVDLGAIAVVKKPFDPLTLAEELIDILERKSPTKSSGVSMFSTNLRQQSSQLDSRLPDDQCDDNLCISAKI